ncbi:Beta-lactamase class C and other penicillin binding protein [Hoeflea phototrophica DFL-43]|uniref:Beta-lactamase class C and other penicillin binding protein n=1 Tax=Hoeflea phototrophica (strain DSM 17068 / NCIMB 14078 / DFL-43) TaxID=411684 RepID=A9D2G3_HOEPD|nr:serine hydrolase [Hoeflea phototrophica]EDQ34200.1 Beta-lactamase class C and other penicillin binding protein [Hoeflea phototrophica DFL-43]
MVQPNQFETVNGFARDTITLANWRTRPYCFWSFRNVSEMVRSARIRTSGPRPLPALAGNPEILARPAWPGAGQSMTELLARAQTDSLVVSRGAGILWEWHAPGVDRSDPHLIFSISKSIAALVAGILEDQGLLNPDTTIMELVPEVRGSAYEDATIRDLLDMRVSLDFDESYLSQGAYARYRRAMGWNPSIGDGSETDGMLALLRTLDKAEHAHGGDHAYLSPNSDMLGIVLERASGERFADLCSRLLWQPLAASADAFITVDNLGAPRTAGGISVRPHDLLALGEMLLSGGIGKGGRIVSERWIKDMRTMGDPDAWARGTQADFLEHGRYRSNWYQVGGGSNAFLAAGIHGQFLYCDPDTDTAIACTSSQHEPQSDGIDQEMLAMFAAICAAP